MLGVPRIRGLRIPVATVLGQLAAGRTADQILADFPDLEADDITASLEYAAAAVQEHALERRSGRRLWRGRRSWGWHVCRRGGAIRVGQGRSMLVA
jgi:uncharacterized protein (DUF433 family)